MKTCKDCLHYGACNGWVSEEALEQFVSKNGCEDFSERFKWVQLPCKVGDYVYSIFSRRCWHLSNKDSPPKAKVVFVGLTNSDYMGGGYFEVLYEDNGTWTFHFSDIGKLVFHTREEAEKALKEREENDCL